MISKLKSRKLWAAVFTAAAVALCKQLGGSDEMCTKFALIGATYIVGQGIADSGKSDSTQH